jgi:L-ascorbate metabolism protein UlaG (beta-lactamase superfamily)
MMARKIMTVCAVALCLIFGCAPAALAQCFAVADRALPVVKASLPAEALARVTWLGHSAFRIETPKGVVAITDYWGFDGGSIPDVVTMNNIHGMHYTDAPDPAIRRVLRGWDPAGGMAEHDITLDDLRVRSVPTNVRGGGGGTRYNGNSIFIFEIEDLCIAHLGHLHHELTPVHLAEIGRIDVLMVPTDGTYTMSHDTAARVIAQIGAPVVIPMHYFGSHLLDSLAYKLQKDYRVVYNGGPEIMLPVKTGGERIILVPSGG